MRQLFRQPLEDVFRGLETVVDEAGGLGLVRMLAGLLVGYAVYVPLHELAHAFACLATGGTVTRLEVQPIFGGALLAQVFPWVVPGGEYAGRLAGFDTHGSDWVYLATDLGPFLLTLLPGVWWLRRAGRRGAAFLFGAATPWALAPFLSLTGDAYEIGSILTTWAPPWSGMPALLRGDDLLKKAPEVAAAGDTVAWLGLGLATLLGALWAFGTYALGGWIARRLGEGALPARAAAPPRS